MVLSNARWMTIDAHLRVEEKGRQRASCSKVACPQLLRHVIVISRGSRFESSEQLLMLSGLSMKQEAAWIAQVTASGGRYSAAGGEPIAISSPEVLFATISDVDRTISRLWMTQKNLN